jgi:hypothetical protein
MARDHLSPSEGPWGARHRPPRPPHAPRPEARREPAPDGGGPARRGPIPPIPRRDPPGARDPVDRIARGPRHMAPSPPLDPVVAIRSALVRAVWIAAIVLVVVGLGAWGTTCTGPRPRPTGETIPPSVSTTLAPSGPAAGG